MTPLLLLFSILAADTSTATASVSSAPQYAELDSGDLSLEHLDLENSDLDDLLAGDSPSLNLYGFLDFSFTQTLTEKHSVLAAFLGQSSFAVGTFNLYLRGDISRRWRSL